MRNTNFIDFHRRSLAPSWSRWSCVATRRQTKKKRQREKRENELVKRKERKRKSKGKKRTASTIVASHLPIGSVRPAAVATATAIDPIGRHRTGKGGAALWRTPLTPNEKRPVDGSTNGRARTPPLPPTPSGQVTLL